MEKLLQNKLFKKLTNIPFVWEFAQNLVGANQWKATLYPSVFANKEGTLLDFGCSVGNSTAAFLDFDYCGIDLDADAIAGARARWKEQPNVRFEQLDILKKPFRKNSFDHVLFACAGHHINDQEIRPIIDALLAELKEGGELHFFDPIRQPGKDKWSTQFFTKIDQGKYIRTEEANRKIFLPHREHIVESRVFPSPDRFLKLQDMLYIRVVK